MKNMTSIICAATMALTTVAAVPVATIATVAIVSADSANAGHTYRRPGQRSRQNQYMSRPKKVDLRCVQQKMSQGNSYDQALRAC